MKIEKYNANKKVMYFTSDGTFSLKGLRELVEKTKHLDEKSDILVSKLFKVDNDTIYFYRLEVKDEQEIKE